MQPSQSTQTDHFIQSNPTANNQSIPSNIKQSKQYSSHQSSNQSNKTPQFLYYKWQIILYYSLLFILFLFWIKTIHNYIINHFHQIKYTLTTSYLTDFIDYYLRPTQISNKQNIYQNMKPLQISPNFYINIYRYNKDSQWQSYRSNLWLLISMALFWRFITYLFYLFDTIIYKNNKTHNQFTYINNSIYIFSLCILLFSFRADILFYITVIFTWWISIQFIIKLKSKYTNSNSQKQIFNRYSIASLWIIVILVLYLNQIFNHFRSLSIYFQSYIPDFLQPLKNSYRTIHCSQFLNMTFLRLLSYGIDRIHQGDPLYQQKEQRLKIKKLIPCQQCQIQNKQVKYCFKGRDHIIKKAHSLKDYLNYTLYTPLLLTGPPVSYNNFFSYQALPAPQVTFKQYVRHILLILSIQVYLHLVPVITLNTSMTLAQMQIFSMFHLVFIWSKFLIIWKTARIWSKMYGVHVIDNMSRCIFNNYGCQGFWRMWHRGFNHWLIRYLYIPLGGKQNIISILAVIAFVAFWHDHTINIVFWALIIALFMVPQILIKRYFRTKKPHLYNTYWFKYIGAFGASINIHFLVICNCIGFGYGVGQMGLVFQKIIQEYQTFIVGILVMAILPLCLFHIRNLEGNIKNF